jgi:hypothetical protein
MILSAAQLSDTDRIAPKHLGRNISWIIAGTENDDLGARDLLQQTFEIAVCRNQDEVVSGGMVQNAAITSRRRSAVKQGGLSSPGCTLSLSAGRADLADSAALLAA